MPWMSASRRSRFLVAKRAVRAKYATTLLRVCILFFVISLAAAAQAVPGVLIIRLKPAKGAPTLETAICDYLANEFQSEGRAAPVVWGVSDPIYRAAIQEGKIRTGTQTPSLDEAFSVAAKLRCEYVFAADLRGDTGGVLSAGYLYKNGKLIWKDPDSNLNPVLASLRQKVKAKQMTQQEYDRAVIDASYRSNAVQVGKYGVEDTLKSLAHTWVEMVATGPMQGLAKQTVRTTPNPGRGEAPPNPGTGTTPPAPVVDDKKWSIDAAAAIKAGDTNKAVSILRDAIDASPLDVARRVLLVKILIQVGQPEVAAREARRAAELMPDHIEFRSLGARAWIQAGNPDEAQNDLNEAVTRAPDSPDTRMLLANVAIAKGDCGSAIDHLNKAITVGPTGDAYYLRALAHAMVGEIDLADADVKKAIDVGLSQAPEDAESRYGLVAAIFDDGLTTIGGEIRTLHMKAQVQRSDKEVQSSFDDLAKRVAGRSKFIAELPVPVGHEMSHNRRLLAYKLLTQCLLDLESYLKSGDGDVLTDSRINLGESLKQGASARQRFREEQQGMKKSDAKSG